MIGLLEEVIELVTSCKVTSGNDEVAKDTSVVKLGNDEDVGSSWVLEFGKGEYVGDGKAVLVTVEVMVMSRRRTHACGSSP